MNDEPLQYRDLFDGVIAGTLAAAVRLAAADPALAVTGLSLLRYQRKAASIRREHAKSGLLVPAVMMVSVTSRCNLACRGCYHRAQHRDAAPEMDDNQLRSIISQASGLGVSVIVFAGGEPLMRKDEIIALAAEHPAILFAVFTNGQLIDEPLADAIAGAGNIVPVLSFEGFRAETDLRRGSGVYDRLLKAGRLLSERRVFSGCSVTITRANIGRVLDEAFITTLLESGTRAFIFVEYVPVEPGTEDLVLRPDQRSILNAALAAYGKKFPALFIGFPGEEDAYGGCLAAGRGFVHVSPAGNLEPCPAAPFSDTNLTKVPLKDALRSEFLGRIRAEHGRLTETNGGCALWTNRDWVQGMLVKP